MPADDKPMRIAIITTDTRESIRTLITGSTVTPPGIGFAPESLLQGFALLPDVDVHVIACLKTPLPSPEKIAPNIYYHGVVVPQAGWLRTLYQGCIRGIRKKLRAIQPDVVHGQGTERYCAISAACSGFPNVITVHGNMRMIAAVNQARPLTFLWLAARLEQFTLPRTDGVVCITSYTKRSVESLARKTWIVPNAVDPGFFDVSPAPDISKPPIGLCVGTVVKHKNQNDFIRALDPLASRLNFKMHFASEPFRGTYGDEFLQLVRERPWCEHIGFLNREQLRARLATASFLALPTREDNCPMVVLEAMAAGVPVLASNVGGVPELIEHEVSGLLCDPEKPATFRASVSRLLDDRPFAARLASSARAQALKRFHPRVIAQQHVQIYREVIAGKK
jgi:glycosyltransferase involved in cell wall biosynthesis